jgi:hypothetical protein
MNGVGIAMVVSAKLLAQLRGTQKNERYLHYPLTEICSVPSSSYQKDCTGAHKYFIEIGAITQSAVAFF